MCLCMMRWPCLARVWAQMVVMCLLNCQLPVNLIAVADKFVSPSLVSVLQSAVPLFTLAIKVLSVRNTHAQVS